MTTYAPRHVDILAWTLPYSQVGSGGRDNYTDMTTARYLGGGRRYTSGAQNDELTYQVALDAGTWSLKMLWERYTNSGIATVYLDATSLGTVDQYGTNTFNNVTTFTGITVASPGVYTLKTKAESKNASSLGYYLTWMSFHLYRTGA